MRRTNEEAKSNKRGCSIIAISVLAVIIVLVIIGARSRDEQRVVEAMSNMFGGGSSGR
jgi:hypothetical protein